MFGTLVLMESCLFRLAEIYATQQKDKVVIWQISLLFSGIVYDQSITLRDV